MKILMKDVLNFLNFYQNISNQKISLSLAYKLAKIKRKLDNEKDFYQEKFNEYLNLYAEKNTNGDYISHNNGIKIKSDKITECNNKIDELNNLEIDIEDFYFTLSELEELKLSPNEIEALLPFIKDE